MRQRGWLQHKKQNLETDALAQFTKLSIALRAWPIVNSFTITKLYENLSSTYARMYYLQALEDLVLKKLSLSFLAT